MRKWLALVVPVVLLVTAGPRLVAEGSSNLAQLALLPHLAQVLPVFELSPCEEIADVSAARYFLKPEIVQDPMQLQEMLFARGWMAWLEGQCLEAEAKWGQACMDSSTSRGVFSCFWISLITQIDIVRVPESSLLSVDLSDYADQFGQRAEEVSAMRAAKFAYQISLRLNPNRDTAERLARLLRREERYGEAVIVWEQVAAVLPPEDPNHWWASGEVAGLEQNWEQAANAYGRGAQVAEDPYEYWMRQGGAFQRMEYWSMAEQVYWRAFWVRMTNRVPCRNLGRVYLQQDQYSQAARWFWAALHLNPHDPWNNYYMAQVLYEVEREEDAAVFLDRAVSFHPDRPWQWAVELGDWRLALNDREAALQAYRQALEWEPGEASIEERIEQATKY